MARGGGTGSCETQTEADLAVRLSGSGKTTLAKRLAEEIPAVRLCPDEWMASLGIDLHDEETRDRLERRFWKHAQDLLKVGQTVILKSSFWLRSDRDEKRLGARALGVPVELRYPGVSGPSAALPSAPVRPTGAAVPRRPGTA
ncbi:predicted protein [Streptomyces sp. C]|nr:predicted protein [Streptomyces sp. C]